MPLRRALAAALAVPVIVAVYLSLLLRRGPLTRVALGLGAGGVALAAAVGIPGGTVGSLPAAQAPLAASALGPAVGTSRGVEAALLVDFDAPMDAASVAAALTVEPAAAVRLAWSSDGRQLSVEPAGRWQPATFYTVTVGGGARDRDGRALATPLRAAFLTRSPTRATLAVVDRLDSGVALDSAVAISFDRPVPIAGVLRALQVEPAIAGRLLAATDGPEGGDPSLADSFVWQPADLYAPSTEYTVSLAAGLLDADGAPVAGGDPLVFTTTTAPAVVRFRPRSGTEDVARDVDVSVRFTAPMDRAATADAFRVEVDGRDVAGKVEWAEGDTVLVFHPGKAFAYGATVVMHVGGRAAGADGTPLDRPRAVQFTVVAKPEAAPPAGGGGSSGGGSSGGGAAPPTPQPTAVPRPASDSWIAAERYLLTLLNCTRGGGWVLSDGSCSSPGGSGIGPLRLDAGISDSVARPYAKKLALSGACSHFSGGNPGDRLRAAGYTGYSWAENIGCRYFADPRDAAVSLVQFFQSERTWSPPGGHWVNMMNPAYDRAGIGLWVSGGNLRFVVDFYRP